MSYGHGDKVEATFAPKRLDTLRPEARPYIGQRAVFSYCWLIGDDDYDPKVYAGQEAWLPPYEWDIGWVPTEDLADVLHPVPRPPEAP